MKKILCLILCLACCDLVAAQTYSLQQLRDSALLRNNAVRAAQHDIRAARQQRSEAFTKYFPNISGTGLWFNADKSMVEMTVDPSEYLASKNIPWNLIPSEMVTMATTVLPAEFIGSLGSLASPITVSMMKNGAIASVTAVQPVFAGGQIVNGNRLAKVGEDVSRLKLQLTKNEVEKTTTQYYWQLLTLQEKEQTVNAVLALLDDIHKDVTAAVKAGVAMRNDLLQVQLRQNDMKSQRLKLQNATALVKMVLAQYCGLRDTAFAVVPPLSQSDYLPELPPTPFGEDGTGQSALGSLPEYRLLEKQVEATKLQRRMEVGKNLPMLGVGAGYNYHNLMDKSFFNPSMGKSHRSFGLIFATVSLPLSDWWGGAYAIKRRKIEQQKAQEQLADHSQLLSIRMQKTWNDVQEALQQIALARQGVEQAQENLRLNRNFYKAGTCRMSDLLEAQLLYQQALDKRSDAYADYHNRLLDYQHAIGQ